jgi:hypothetical protein
MSNCASIMFSPREAFDPASSEASEPRTSTIFGTITFISRYFNSKISTVALGLFGGKSSEKSETACLGT